MKLYIAHSITAAQGGSILGVFSTYKKAEKVVAGVLGIEPGSEGCDWGHFVRVGELDKPFYVLNLPRSTERGGGRREKDRAERNGVDPGLVDGD